MKKLLKYGIIAIILITIIVLGINLYVRISTNKQIIKENDYTALSDVDCIIILGAGIWKYKPSPMLEDRLLEGIKLYQNNVSDKIIMSGDHGRREYDEVNIMKNYAIEKVPEDADVIVTHENLLERAQGANPGIRIVTIQNFLKDQNIDDLYEEIVQKNQK